MNPLDFTKLRPGGYYRKSSEAEDKQMLSIDSQIDAAAKMAEYHKLPVFTEVFKEAKSAKTENERPEFSRMMSMILKGEIDSIVCWKLDRLARNMTEGGQIIDLLSSGVLKAIITHDKVFYPWDNVIVMSVEFSQGKQFVKELSVNVKRGHDKKARLGVPHGISSLGFLNDRTEEKGNRRWMVDEERLPKIKILLDMFLTGTYSAGKIYEYAINELKLNTIKRKKIGGHFIAHSRIYELLPDPVYAGFFFDSKGERFELDPKLPRLITEDQHNKIKMIIARNNIPKTQEHKTIFSGFIASPEGNFIGQDVKYQLICDCKHKFAYRSKTHCPQCGREITQLQHPKYLGYVHYYNVKKKKSKLDYVSIPENKVLEKVIHFVQENLNFSVDLANWSKQYIEELKEKEINDKIFKKKMIESNNAEFDHKKTRLREMLRDEQVSPEEYALDLKALEKKYHVNEGEKDDVDWYARMNEIVDLTLCLTETLKKGTVQAKRTILAKLGSNLVWDEKELSICNTKAINKLIEGIKKAKSKDDKFEPKNCFVNKSLNKKTSEISPVFSTLLPRTDEFRTL